MNVVISDPYKFVPAYRGRLGYMAIGRYYLPGYQRRHWCLDSVETHGLQHVSDSLSAGHGIVLAGNHARLCDAFVMMTVSVRLAQPFYFPTSWHLFHKSSAVNRWIMRTSGACSLFREGIDWEGLEFAIDALATAERPVVLFPEGILTRHNDRLAPFLGGLGYVARAAAERRAEANGGQVVVHPFGIRYHFEGDAEATFAPALAKLEHLLKLGQGARLPLVDRVRALVEAWLRLKEVEHLGQPADGPRGPRRTALIDHLLRPAETEWLRGRSEGSTIERVKRVQVALVASLAEGQVDGEERARRVRQLEAAFLAYQLGRDLDDYLDGQPTPERLLETLERVEEDVTGEPATPVGPIRVVVRFGPAMPVPPEESWEGGADTLTAGLRQPIESLMSPLAPATASSY